MSFKKTLRNLAILALTTVGFNVGANVYVRNGIEKKVQTAKANAAMLEQLNLNIPSLDSLIIKARKLTIPEFEPFEPF